jgi:hypothetical protein
MMSRGIHRKDVDQLQRGRTPAKGKSDFRPRSSCRSTRLDHRGITDDGPDRKSTVRELQILHAGQHVRAVWRPASLISNCAGLRRVVVVNQIICERSRIDRNVLPELPERIVTATANQRVVAAAPVENIRNRIPDPGVIAGAADGIIDI